MRQPHALNASSDCTAASTHSTPVANRLPSATPACGHEDQKPRWLSVAVLGGHQHRAAPLATDGEALHEPADEQQDRRADADRGVRRQQPDRKGRDAHHQQRDDQHLLAADPVAEVPEDHAAEGARDEAERVGAERQQRPGGLLALREEQLAEDQGGRGAVEEEVVPLDGGADEGGEDDLDDVGLRRARVAWAGLPGDCVDVAMGGAFLGVTRGIGGWCGVRRRSSRRPSGGRSR